MDLKKRQYYNQGCQLMHLVGHSPYLTHAHQEILWQNYITQLHLFLVTENGWMDSLD